MRTPVPLLAAAALAFAVVAPAGAQTRPPSSPSYGASGSYRPAPDDDQAPRGEQGAQQDSSQDLVRQLNLRSDQQAAFRDYQSAFSAQGQDQADEGDDIARLAAMTTPQRLDDSARQMDRDRADFERVSAATRRFYATLDSSQRRTFDRLTAPQADAGDDADDAPPPGPGRR